ncbi:ABC transporter permease [Salinibacterium hongtaonis]|uniref:ABC transporter permease n=1 Tax=Homoserinimonas hongtaonis TaxID=2079791 RepID=A0A2U1T2H1_9MICO|nr:ABC transporter permease [Salinibacterium hongtaonis]PWB98079.1 ABC transporter permease [Salinibacterium hongtaonis]
MNWVLENLDLIGRLSLEHIRLSLVPIVAGLLISVPIGWLAFRFQPARGVILTVTGLLYTIPSLALFVILPPLLGISYLSELNVVIALTIYVIAIMSRSVADGLGSVEPATRQAAIAMGYAPWRRFWTVDFPLAGPVILSGLRVAAASTVSLVTIGILIGVESLGYLFTNGYQRRIVPEIFAGVIMVMLIALVIDVVLMLAGRMLLPWARATTESTTPARERMVEAA